jgi:hypothetical protein
MAVESTSAPEHVESKTAPLPAGLSAQEVCEEYFKACYEKEPERWLSCLHLDKRALAISRKPGPFDVCQWDLGRARVEKYMARYVFKRQVGDQKLKDSEPVVVLEYQPVYGPVPGYIDSTDLGAPIHITVQKQGGASNGEWRVISGAF